MQRIDKTAIVLWVIFAVPLVVFAIAVVAELILGL
jgi:hypothetical protein